MLKRLTCWWRLWWGLCPACNSDAPEIDTCQVCSGYRWIDQGGPPNDYLKAFWRYKFLNEGK